MISCSPIIALTKVPTVCILGVGIGRSTAAVEVAGAKAEVEVAACITGAGGCIAGGVGWTGVGVGGKFSESESCRIIY